jgi:potassium/hydrogen antiporter
MAHHFSFIRVGCSRHSNSCGVDCLLFDEFADSIRSLAFAVISSTDPATLIPIFKQITIREKVRQTIESESAFDDTTGSILTFTLLGIILGQTKPTVFSSAWSFVREAGGGIMVGILIGFAGTLLTSEHK